MTPSAPGSTVTASHAVPGYRLEAPTVAELRSSLERVCGTRFAQVWLLACREADVSPVAGRLPLDELDDLAQVVRGLPGLPGVVGQAMHVRITSYRTLFFLSGASR
jgi:hypothetical protein